MALSITIDRNKNQVLKKDESGKIELEVKMTKHACELSKTSGLFHVPHVLDYNCQEGWILFEYVPNIQPLYKFIVDQPLMSELSARLGKSIAFIHNNLKLSENEARVLPDDLNKPDRSDGKAFIHGDFNLVNVQYNKEHDQLVILDWSFTTLIDQTCNWGGIFWDLGWMTQSIITVPPFYFFRNSFRMEITELFLEHYRKNSNFDFDPDEFKDYMECIYDTFSSIEWNRIEWYKYKMWYYYAGHWKSRKLTI